MKEKNELKFCTNCETFLEVDESTEICPNCRIVGFLEPADEFPTVDPEDDLDELDEVLFSDGLKYF